MRPWILLACLVAGALVAGCGNLFDTAAAVVGGRKITMNEVSDALDRFSQTEEYKQLAAQGDAESIKRRFEQAYLSQLIRRSVLAPKAEEFGISVSEEEVQDTIEGIEDDFGSQNAFEEALKEQGLDQEQLEQIVRDRILEDKLREEVTADVEASDADIEAYYEENIDDYRRMRSSHILVRDFDLADQLSTQLKAAPKRNVEGLFARLARQHSIDLQSARDGGDQGYTTSGELPDRYERVAVNLKIGEVSGPVQTEEGYHVIMVTDRDVSPLADVRIAIAGQLREGAAEETWQDWVTEAYREAEIRVNSRYGELDLESKQVVDATSEDIPGAVATPTPSPSL